MSSLKISEMNSGSTLQSVDLLPINRSGVNYKISGTDIKNYITTYGTTLPGSPGEGDIHILVDSITTPNYTWQFRYNSNSASSYKWEFIGGAPGSTQIATSESTASGSYVDLATAGPTFTLPNAGDYEILFGCNVNPPDSSAYIAEVAVKRGGAATSGSDGFACATHSGGGSTVVVGGLSKMFRATGAAASDAYKVQYGAVGGTVAFSDRFIKVFPIRIG